jgi:hypothetical protein
MEGKGYVKAGKVRARIPSYKVTEGQGTARARQ